MNGATKLLLGAAVVTTLVLLAVPKRQPEIQHESIAAASPGPVASSAVVELSSVATEGQLTAQAARSASIAWGRDPFAVPARAEEPAEEPTEVAAPAVEQEPATALPVAPVAKPRLTGVSTLGTESWAIVDGEVVTEGELLSSGFRVCRISSRSITVLMNDIELTLRLGDEP